MSYTFKFDEAVGCFFVRWTGTITAGEYHSIYRMARGQPWFREGLKRIHDSRNAVLAFTPTDVLSQARTFDVVAPEFGEVRGAIIMSRAEDMVLLRTFVGASEKAQTFVKIFDNYDDARAWAGLPEDYPDPFEDDW